MLFNGVRNINQLSFPKGETERIKEMRDFIDNERRKLFKYTLDKRRKKRRPIAMTEQADNKQVTAECDLTDNSTGKKYDAGKPMVGTLLRVFPNALMFIGKCIEFGTHKYPDPNNWKMVENAQHRYLDSLGRHLLKHLSGIKYDEETGLPHLAHAAWNMLAILELAIMNKEYATNGKE